MKKGLRQRDAAAFKVQQQARDHADEEARRIPWQLYCKKPDPGASTGRSSVFGSFGNRELA